MESQICDWRDGLPNELLECVLEKFDSNKDVLLFASVCRNWRSTVKRCAKQRVDGTDAPPMLLVGHETDRHALWTFDVPADRYLRNKLSLDVYVERFCGSSCGWLGAVNKDWSVTLYKPFSATAAPIHLPPVFPPPPETLPPAIPWSRVPLFYPYHVRKLLLSADPVENRGQCVVVVSGVETNGLAVFRLGRDTAWSVVRCPIEYWLPQELMLLRGSCRVYGLGDSGDVVFFDLDRIGIDQDMTVLRPEDIRTPIEGTRRYMVQSRDGETYLVRRFYTNPRSEDCYDERRTSKFKVFSMDLGTGKYKRVSSIGDNALFIGDNISICVKASSARLPPNCIYFTHDLDSRHSCTWLACDIGIYDIQTKHFKERFPIPYDTYVAMGRRPPIFFLPTLNV